MADRIPEQEIAKPGDNGNDGNATIVGAFRSWDAHYDLAGRVYWLIRLSSGDPEKQVSRFF